MSQRGLIYSFAAKGTVVLAEHTSYSGNFSTIAVQCLQKLPSNSSKYTYSCDGHTFNFLIDNGFVFLVVADESVGRNVPFVFLERVKDDFKQRYGPSIKDEGPHPLADEDYDDLFEDRFSIAYNLDREFGPRLKEHMEYCMNHPEEMTKLAKLKAQISEVIGIVMVNNEKMTVITASQQSAIDSLIHDLGCAFPVKDLGCLSYFLSIEVDHIQTRLILSQRQYIKALLSRSHMLFAKLISSPMAASLKLSKHDSTDFEDATLYRSIVGGLQYLSLTRPDISFAVNKICQFMYSPKNSHWSAVKRMLRYLKGTINFGLLFKPQCGLHLQTYSDADWGGCHDGSTGFVFIWVLI